MESDLSVHHRIAHNEVELASLRKSKYVQGDMGTTVQKVRQHLENGDAVLFVGCPCQVAGLKRYLGHLYEKLWTVDVICHGVPSAQMLRESLAEMPDVSSVDFRDKDYGWECLGMTVIRNDGSRHRLSYNESRYDRDFIPILRFAKAAMTVNSVNFLGRAIYLSVIFGMLRNITQKSIKKME